MAASAQGLEIKGQSKIPGDRPGQDKRLVETPLSEALHMERHRNDPVVIMDWKMLSDTGGKDLPEGDSGRDFPPVFQGMNGFQKDGFVSPDGTADLEGGRRFVHRGHMIALFRRKAEGHRISGTWEREKGNPAPAFLAEAAALTGNQKIVT